MRSTPDTVTALAEAIRRGEVSSREAVQNALDRIDAVDGDLHAFLARAGERGLRQAAKVDEARSRGESLGCLAGVPVALKDNICTTFGATTCGSRILEHFHSQYDAHVVRQLEAAGAIIIGKTNLDEFAMGSSTENSAFGMTKNPWDLTRVAGGSSGGSAAAVAARLVPAALGSDTGGSVRLPASFCGVVGLKPSYGRVSRYGLVAFGSSLDQIGPLTRTVEDAALLLTAIAGHDPRDSTSANVAAPDYVRSLKRPASRVRIGISEELFGEGCDPTVRDAVKSAVRSLNRAGADVIEISLPHLSLGIACYYIIATAEASSNLARFDGVRYGYRTRQPVDIHGLYEVSRGDAFGAEVKRRIMLGTYALSSGYYDAYYLSALKVRSMIVQDFQKAFEQVDVIASPVAPTTAFVAGEKANDPLSMYLEDIYTVPANLAGLCAISVPCGADARGLPIGLQLMAKPFGEEQLLAVAHQFQLATAFHEAMPPIAAAAER